MIFFKENLAFLINENSNVKKDILQKFGIGKSEIYNMIHGKTGPSVAELSELSDYFNISIDDLVKKDLSKINEILKEDIKFLVLDIDGVMTDGGMYYTESGDEFKKFDSKDGLAIRKLTNKDFPVGIISSGFNSELIKRRAELLGIKYVHADAVPKLGILQGWSKKLNIKFCQKKHKKNLIIYIVSLKGF